MKSYIDSVFWVQIPCSCILTYYSIIVAVAGDDLLHVLGTVLRARPRGTQAFLNDVVIRIMRALSVG